MILTKQPGSPFPGQEAVPDTDSFQNTAKNPYMREAINEALDGITHKHGGPFGSIIVKDGKIITSRGAGTAISFALRIIHALEGEDVSDEIKKSIVYMD